MSVRFVAEISSNHNRDLRRAKQFIEAAAEIGCDAVKFQLFKIEELFAPEILHNSASHRKRRDWELPIEYIQPLSAHAHDLGLEFGCTPFYLDAVDILEPYVDFYKIASYEILWKELFMKCSSTGKPIVFSIGMATLDEIEDAIVTIKMGKTNSVSILHCNSAYPSPIKDSNLNTIHYLRDKLKDIVKPIRLNVGWSDHSCDPAVVYRAVHHHHASEIEFHLDLDGKGDEFSAGHCWLPEEIETVIHSVQNGFNADGESGVYISKSEEPDRNWRADPSDGLRPFKSVRKNFKCEKENN